jgi:serine/threonine-protein kinase
MKPDNVQLVERADDKDFVKVLDFGIAKVGGSTSKLTQAGKIFGTPHYMSPEQCAGTSVDHRTDIYAVGIMLYELATGKVPFDADNLMGILTKHLYENPIPPHELPPPVNVPASLEAVILKCLAKKPEQRYQSMHELLQDIDAVSSGLTPKAVVDQVARNTHASSTASDIDAPGRLVVGLGMPEVPGRRSVLPLVLGGLVLLGGAVTGFLVFGSNAPDAQHVVKPAVAPGAAAAPGATAEPEPPPAPPSVPAQPVVAAAPPTVVTSDPERAEVYRDGVLLGNTPFTLQRPTGPGEVMLDLRLGGYEHKAIAITSTSGESLAVTLDRAKATRRPVAVKPPTTEPKSDKPKPDKPRRGPQSEVLDPWD